MKKHCKECPWVVDNRHNRTITNHSKRLNKKHNCHMVTKDIWDENKGCQCVGNKLYLSKKL